MIPMIQPFLHRRHSSNLANKKNWYSVALRIRRDQRDLLSVGHTSILHNHNSQEGKKTPCIPSSSQEHPINNDMEVRRL
jgi:hypothetical protein